MSQTTPTTAGRPPANKEQVALVLQLADEGKSPQEILADSKVTLKQTKVYEILRLRAAQLEAAAKLPDPQPELKTA